MENNNDKCKYETRIYNNKDHSLKIEFSTYEQILENYKDDLTEIELKALKNMETKETTFLDRLISEEQELNTKVEKLYEFITTPGSEEKVGEDQYGLLLVQYSAMKAYRDVLLIRIHKLKQ